MSDNQLWDDVDAYIGEHLVGHDDVQEKALDDAREAGLPQIQVSAPFGKLLHLLVRICGARRVLEVGTLGGYSAIWLARALPAEGRLVTLELQQHHADVARTNLDRAGVGDVAEVRVGPALESLAALEREGGDPFDLVFIDADKVNGAAYVDWAIRLGHPGTVIVVDNVVREGKVIDEASDDQAVIGTRAVYDKLSSDPRLDATAIQTVGSKNYDGFALAVVAG